MDGLLMDGRQDQNAHLDVFAHLHLSPLHSRPCSDCNDLLRLVYSFLVPVSTMAPFTSCLGWRPSVMVARQSSSLLEFPHQPPPESSPLGFADEKSSFLHYLDIVSFLLPIQKSLVERKCIPP